MIYSLAKVKSFYAANSVFISLYVPKRAAFT